MFFKLPSLFLKISLFKSCRFPILNISQMCFSITLLEAITTFLSLLLFLPNSFKADTLQWLRSPLSLWPRITMPGLLLNSHAVPLSPSFSFLRVPNSFLPYCFFICLYFLSEGNTLYIWLTCFYFRSQKKIFFWLHWAACRILVSWTGIKPKPLAMEAQSLSHWTTREALSGFNLNSPSEGIPSLISQTYVKSLQWHPIATYISPINSTLSTYFSCYSINSISTGICLTTAAFSMLSKVHDKLFVLNNLWMIELIVKVSPPCLTLCNPMDYTVNGILQARILE